jgi:hypothetical protein
MVIHQLPMLAKYAPIFLAQYLIAIPRLGVNAGRTSQTIFYTSPLQVYGVVSQLIPGNAKSELHIAKSRWGHESRIRTKTNLKAIIKV